MSCGGAAAAFLRALSRGGLRYSSPMQPAPARGSTSRSWVAARPGLRLRSSWAGCGVACALDAGDPAHAVSERVHGFFGHDGIPPPGAATLGRGSFDHTSVSVRTVTVDAIRLLRQRLRRHRGWDGVSAGVLLLCTGARYEPPPLEGAAELWSSRRIRPPLLSRVGAARPASGRLRRRRGHVRAAAYVAERRRRFADGRLRARPRRRLAHPFGQGGRSTRSRCSARGRAWRACAGGVRRWLGGRARRAIPDAEDRSERARRRPRMRAGRVRGDRHG